MSKTFVKSIATLEIPVARIEPAVEWYTRILGFQVLHQTATDAMLRLGEEASPSAPRLYLVAAASPDRLFFLNNDTGVTHGIIDFYVSELEEFHLFLKNHEVSVTAVHYFNGSNGVGGFGFSDLDGNHFGATNVVE
ncbi:hypothetical protein AMQ84_29405 [Paenibacillus riograndensis]|uniref:VOC domain-containing protein n=1 Tax=Paenibacillus riograndensis TaxID=483937 RepID=A0A132TIG2_9BACL|nr:VOC family protein [Paenibacillus riograndensis]KWX71127.1 hypothetical protein AMQ84_29405 [Paenibacillus riograndensis]